MSVVLLAGQAAEESAGLDLAMVVGDRVNQEVGITDDSGGTDTLLQPTHYLRQPDRRLRGHGLVE
ncbi:MAG: hypothetical protein ACRDZT_07620, partial [Acidimicrobiales bacterium]